VTSFNNPTERVIPVDHVINETDPNEPDSKRQGRVIVGALGGLAIGLLLATGAQQNSPDPEAAPSTITAPTAVPTVPTTTTVLAPSRLDILVDGYEGTLFLAGAVNQQGKLWRWESRTGTPLELDTPDHTGVAAFNASDVRVGSRTLSSFSRLPVLWVGTPGNQEPLAVDVFNWSWHESDPSLIAWLELRLQEDPPTVLLQQAALPSGAISSLPIADMGPEVADLRIALFDDSGVILQGLTEDGYGLWTVDPATGEPLTTVSGRFVGILPDDDLLISQAGQLVRLNRDLGEDSEFTFVSDSRMSETRPSPVDARWAIWEIEESTGVAAPTQLWIIEDDEVIFETTLPSALRAVAWSQDGHWLITAVGEPSPLSGFSSGELWFIDTSDWSMHAVDAPGFITTIAAVP